MNISFLVYALIVVSIANFVNPSTLSAHTYFVKRDYVNQTGLTSYNNSPSNTDDFYSLFAAYADRNNQFISGITIKGLRCYE